MNSATPICNSGVPVGEFIPVVNEMIKIKMKDKYNDNVFKNYEVTEENIEDIYDALLLNICCRVIITSNITVPEIVGI